MAIVIHAVRNLRKQKLLIDMNVDITEFLDKKYKEKYVIISKNKVTVNACNQYRSPVLIRRYWNLGNNLAYILGLWFGDKYVYGNRVGLSNKNPILLKEFERFLVNISSSNVHFVVENGIKTKVYINSSLLRRVLEGMQQNTNKILRGFIIPYLAGRIDSDGCILTSNLKHNSGLAKITYDKLKEAEADKKLLSRLKCKSCILKYEGRNAFDLKISVSSCTKLFPFLLKYVKSIKKRNNISFCLAARTIKLVP